MSEPREADRRANALMDVAPVSVDAIGGQDTKSISERIAKLNRAIRRDR